MQHIHPDYFCSKDASLLNIPLIHSFLRETYWAKDIPLSTVERAIQHSLCFGIYHHELGQVGFARVITDQTSFAYLADVFVLPAHRARGLSKQLMHFIHAQPELQGLRRWLLVTKDAQGLYEQFGWELIPQELAGRVMQIHQPNIYQHTDNSQFGS